MDMDERGDKTSEESYVMSIDVGTTIIKCHIYNKKAECVGEAVEENRLNYPNQGMVEIDPEELWTAFLKVCHNAIQSTPQLT